jgi:hypothetical protein
MKPRALIVLLVAASLIAPSAQGLLAFCLSGDCPMDEELKVVQKVVAEHCSSTENAVAPTLIPSDEGCCLSEEQIPAAVLSTGRTGSQLLACCLLDGEDSSAQPATAVLQPLTPALLAAPLEEFSRSLEHKVLAPQNGGSRPLSRSLFTLHSSFIL